MTDKPVTATAALTTNEPCAVPLTPPITTGGRLRLASLTVKVSDDEMWGRLNG